MDDKKVGCEVVCVKFDIGEYDYKNIPDIPVYDPEKLWEEVVEQFPEILAQLDERYKIII